MTHRAQTKDSHSKLKWLEDLKLHVIVKKGLLKNNLEQQQKPEKPQKRQRDQSRLKNLDLTISSSGEW